MRSVRTTKCRDFGHSEFVLYVPDESELHLDSLIEEFERAVAKGGRFSDGDILHLGGVPLRLFQSSAEDLEVFEPSFDGFPIRWRKGVGDALRVHTIQKLICEEVGQVPEFASLLSVGVVSPTYFSLADQYQMSRDETDGNDSGWVFTETDNVGEQGAFASLYEVTTHHRSVLPFLALPGGTRVVRTAREVSVETPGRILESGSNETLRRVFLADWFRQSVS